MRLLHVVMGYYPDEKFGGPAKSVEALVQGLRKQNHETTVCTANLISQSKKTGSKSLIRNVRGINVIYFNAYSLGSYGFTFMPSVIPFLFRSLCEYDLVHIHGYRNFLAVSFSIGARFLNIPYLIQPEGTLPRLIQRYRLKQWFDRMIGGWMLHHAAAAIAVVELERSQLLAAGVPSERVFVIPNGMDFSEEFVLPPAGLFRRRIGVDQNCKLIAFMGRLHPIKRVDLLIEAFARINIKGAHLAIVGPDDGQLLALQQLVSGLGLNERVFFTGPIYGNKRYQVYVDSDVVVLPSEYDIFSMTVLESLFCRTPVIVTDRCGISELVKDEVGLVVPLDVGAMAEAITLLFNDKILYTSLKQRTFDLAVEHFNMESIVARICKIYEKIK